MSGADNGIGSAYAKQMAEKGLDVVLIGENKNQLQLLAKDIGTDSNYSYYYLLIGVTFPSIWTFVFS